MILEFLYAIIATHITIICVTLYLHRSQAHRSCVFNPVVSHCMRFWLWLTTGMNTKEWVAVHRLHHQKCDTAEDPHSPKFYGIYKVLFGGVLLYYKAAKNLNNINKLGYGTPNDWIEKKLYTPFSWLGVMLLFLINIWLFGWSGVVIWLVQMIWIPFWAAGVINGIGHWCGYRNGSTRDNSRNIVPWGIVVGGEELHNAHHLDPASPKLSMHWWEFDIGWMYLCILRYFGLAKVRSE